MAGTTDRDSGLPRWVKACAIVAVVVLLLVVALLLAGHGPGRHRGAGLAATASQC